MEFIPLKITTVKANAQLTFDLYILFKDQYLCYTSQGDSIDEEKLIKLVNQEIADFYIPKGQMDNVTAYLNQTIEMALSSENSDIEEKVNLIEGVASTAITQMQQEPNEKSYSITQKAAKGLRHLIKDNPSALKRLFGKKSKEADLIINHCINVCGLATKLAEYIRLPDSDIDDLATAALIHDIGLTQTPPDIVNLFAQDFDQLDNESKYEYYKHTKLSTQLLSAKTFLSPQVESLIQNHEENLQGSGPYKLTKLSPLQECLNLTNAYDKRVISKGETPAQAYKAFQIDNIGIFNLELIKRFESVLKEEGLLQD